MLMQMPVTVLRTESNVVVSKASDFLCTSVLTFTPGIGGLSVWRFPSWVMPETLETLDSNFLKEGFMSPPPACGLGRHRLDAGCSRITRLTVRRVIFFHRSTADSHCVSDLILARRTPVCSNRGDEHTRYPTARTAPPLSAGCGCHVLRRVLCHVHDEGKARLVLGCLGHNTWPVLRTDLRLRGQVGRRAGEV